MDMDMCMCMCMYTLTLAPYAQVEVLRRRRRLSHHRLRQQHRPRTIAARRPCKLAVGEAERSYDTLPMHGLCACPRCAEATRCPPRAFRGHQRGGAGRRRGGRGGRRRGRRRGRGGAVAAQSDDLVSGVLHHRGGKRVSQPASQPASLSDDLVSGLLHHLGPQTQIEPTSPGPM